MIFRSVARPYQTSILSFVRYLFFIPFGAHILVIKCQLSDDQTQSVESKSAIRSCIKVPASLGPSPDVKDWGCIPEASTLGIQPAEACKYVLNICSLLILLVLWGFKVSSCLCLLMQVNKGMAFIGGESAALSRVHEYFWKKAIMLSCVMFLFSVTTYLNASR